MDLYHIWCDLKQGVTDTAFCDAVGSYLGQLQKQEALRGFRVTRRKLGLGPKSLGEFHVILEFDDLAQLDRAFTQVSARRDPVEELHHAVNRWATNLTFALYRDFPDPGRRRGEERF